MGTPQATIDANTPATIAVTIRMSGERIRPAVTAVTAAQPTTMKAPPKELTSAKRDRVTYAVTTVTSTAVTQTTPIVSRAAMTGSCPIPLTSASAERQIWYGARQAGDALPGTHSVCVVPFCVRHRLATSDALTAAG